ncbi:MAG: phosphocarrier protein HPr [Clostridia bacterium BRH_c25]|nr:MAG: phosphocarrier protein HPr [Clostridia bacterium BRH_c25]
MYKVDVVLKNETGLHARPAHIFVTEASKFKSEIILKRDQDEYDAKSIISVLCMGAFKGDTFTIIAEGEDEMPAVEALKVLIDNNVGE